MPGPPVNAGAPSRAFEQAMIYVFNDEGGFAARPTEGGGAVNMGITYTVFCAWRAKQGKPKPTFADLHAMSKDEASAIYRAKFANVIRFDELPRGVGYVVLDSAVNNGVSGAMRVLANALGTDRPAPGHGPTDVMLAAIAQRGPAGVIDAFCDERLREQKTFKTYAKHITKMVLGRVISLPRTWGQAWDGRVEKVRARGLAMLNDGVKA